MLLHLCSLHKDRAGETDKLTGVVAQILLELFTPNETCELVGLHLPTMNMRFFSTAKAITTNSTLEVIRKGIKNKNANVTNTLIEIYDVATFGILCTILLTTVQKNTLEGTKTVDQEYQKFGITSLK